MTSSSTFLLGVATTSVMGFGGYKIIQDSLTVGEFVEFTVLLGLMIAPIVQMSSVGSQLTEALAGLDRTEELMNLEEESDEENRTIELDKVVGRMSFSDVSFSYEEDKEVLHNISFDVEPGQVIALVGSSGSGKSTIAGLAASFLNPDSGTIIIDGHDLSKVNLNSFRQHLGVVLQDDFLFEGTIRENILFPRPDASEEKLLEAVKAAYVDEFTDRFDKGLDTLIGERGVKLSGGQRQRIGIARAIALNPKLVICDEPVSALDVSIQSQILNLLVDLQREFKLSYLFIAHDLAVVKHVSDRVAIMYLGKIVETAASETIYHRARHPYTQSLIAAIPVPDPHRSLERQVLRGDVPSPINPPSGCSFHPRCPVAEPRCAEQAPELVEVGAGQLAACHLIQRQA